MNQLVNELLFTLWVWLDTHTWEWVATHAEDSLKPYEVDRAKSGQVPPPPLYLNLTKSEALLCLKNGVCCQFRMGATESP